MRNIPAAQPKEILSPSVSPAGKINSHNEWDKLKEVIVGTAKGSMAVLTWTKPDPIPAAALEKAKVLAKQAFPDWFIQEIEENL